MNDAITESSKPVSYCRVSDAVDWILRQDRVIWLSKVDVKDAFRIVPINYRDSKYLGMRTGGAYFVDTVLPMGSGSPCAIFQALT